MSSSVTIAEAPTTGIGRLITENRFFVPTHQRDYKWDRERVEKYIDDLVEAKSRGDKFYFIGLMVFMRTDDNRLRVLDGQQRLATTIILFSALRAWFSSAEPTSSMVVQLEYDFIGRTEYGETKKQPKLNLNRNNDDKFQAYVVNGSPLDIVKADLKKTGKNASNHLLLDAIVYTHQRVSELAKNVGTVDAAKTYFSELIKFVRDSVIAVRLTVPNESNAFRVFETLNDRGMDLSAVDLIKNHLFGLAYDSTSSSQDLAQLEHRWSQLTETLQNLRQEDFLKVYWTSRHGLIQLDDIFDAVKDTTKTKQEAVNLSVDLLEASQDYAALDNPDDPGWAPQTLESKELIGRLKVLGSKLVRPVVLSGMKKLGPAEFEKLLRVLEVVVVRWQVVGQRRTGTIERVCAKLAQLIWDGEATARADFITALSELYTPDDEFKEDFITQDNLTRQKAVYLLKRIEDYERSSKLGQAGKGLGPKADLTLEHILPENPGPDWKPKLDANSKLADMWERTGNLCLLPVGSNKGLGNVGYAAKISTYLNSDLLTTKQVAAYADWDANAIEARQVWLAGLAVQIWRAV